MSVDHSLDNKILDLALSLVLKQHTLFARECLRIIAYFHPVLFEQAVPYNHIDSILFQGKLYSFLQFVEVCL